MSEVKVDTRSPITSWDLLVWAYEREMVRYAGVGSPPADEGDLQHISATATVGGALNAGRVIRLLDGSPYVNDNPRGCINGRPSAHRDADVVHWELSRFLPGETFVRFAEQAESGAPPNWNPPIPEFKEVDVLGTRGKNKGKPKPIYSGRSGGRVIGFEKRREPLNEYEKDAILRSARLQYLGWWVILEQSHKFLVGNVEKRLKRWRITGIGALAMPWESCELEDCGRKAVD